MDLIDNSPVSRAHQYYSKASTEHDLILKKDNYTQAAKCFLEAAQTLKVDPSIVSSLLFLSLNSANMAKRIQFLQTTAQTNPVIPKDSVHKSDIVIENGRAKSLTITERMQRLRLIPQSEPSLESLTNDLLYLESRLSEIGSSPSAMHYPHFTPKNTSFHSTIVDDSYSHIQFLPNTQKSEKKESRNQGSTRITSKTTPSFDSITPPSISNTPPSVSSSESDTLPVPLSDSTSSATSSSTVSSSSSLSLSPGVLQLLHTVQRLSQIQKKLTLSFPFLMAFYCIYFLLPSLLVDEENSSLLSRLDSLSHHEVEQRKWREEIRRFKEEYSEKFAAWNEKQRQEREREREREIEMKQQQEQQQQLHSVFEQKKGRKNEVKLKENEDVEEDDPVSDLPFSIPSPPTSPSSTHSSQSSSSAPLSFPPLPSSISPSTSSSTSVSSSSSLSKSPLNLIGIPPPPPSPSPLLSSSLSSSSLLFSSISSLSSSSIFSTSPPPSSLSSSIRSLPPSLSLSPTNSSTNQPPLIPHHPPLSPSTASASSTSQLLARQQQLEKVIQALVTKIETLTSEGEKREKRLKKYEQHHREQKARKAQLLSPNSRSDSSPSNNPSPSQTTPSSVPRPMMTPSPSPLPISTASNSNTNKPHSSSHLPRPPLVPPSSSSSPPTPSMTSHSMSISSHPSTSTFLLQKQQQLSKKSSPHSGL